jgi:hypothetical protein
MESQYFLKIRDSYGNYYKTFYRLQVAIDYQTEQLLEQSEIHGRTILLPIFAIDRYNQKGNMVKMYVVCNYNSMWNYYSRVLTVDTRHFYEIILLFEPCHLHIDAEVETKNNPTADEKFLHNTFIGEVFILLIELNIISSEKQVKLITLNSTNPSKISKHYKFEIEGKIFRNNYHCGSFARQLDEKLLKKYGPKKPTLNENGELKENPFWVWKDSQTEFTNHEEKTGFMDLSIFTKNRNFRIFGSSKKNKPAFTLKKEDDNGNILETFDKETFYSTLLQRHDDNDELIDCLEDGIEPVSTSISKGQKKRKPSPSKKLNVSFTKVQMTEKPTVYDVYIEMIREHIQKYDKDDIIIQISKSEEAPYILNVSTTSHYCELLSKSQGSTTVTSRHKSNNVYFVINTNKNIYYQKCYDDRECCNRKDKKSAEYKFPKIVLDSIIQEEAKTDELWLNDNLISEYLDCFNFC